MMSYEAFREQCAKVCDDHAQMATSGDGNEWSASCAEAIRALPLPEVNYEIARKEFEKWVINQGVAMDYRGDGIYGNPTVRRWHEGFIAATELGFCGNANNEALRKENEQLREALIDLISIVKIHQEATKNRFAWAEIDCAEEALKGGAA